MAFGTRNAELGTRIAKTGSLRSEARCRYGALDWIAAKAGEKEQDSKGGRPRAGATPRLPAFAEEIPAASLS